MTLLASFLILSCGLGSSAFFKCLLYEIIKGDFAGDWLCMICEKLGFSCGTAERVCVAARGSEPRKLSGISRIAFVCPSPERGKHSDGIDASRSGYHQVMVLPSP
jgi:hypothetical protein